jgi:hypothetical protein
MIFLFLGIYGIGWLATLPFRFTWRLGRKTVLRFTTTPEELARIEKVRERFALAQFMASDDYGIAPIHYDFLAKRLKELAREEGIPLWKVKASR